MQIVVTFTPLVLLVVLLVVVALVRVRSAIEEARAIVEGTDPALRRVGLACLGFAIAVAIGLASAGVEIPGAVAVAAITGLGSLSFVAGAFGLQGLLVETDTQRRLRMLNRAPIASTRGGRVLALAFGSVPFVGWVVWCLG